MDEKIKTTVLNEVLDKRFHRFVEEMLCAFKAEKIDEAWGVAGSQALSTWNYRVLTTTVVLEDETYMGLSLTGPAALVDEMTLYLRRIVK
jgi:hypothetical protein